MSAVVLLPQEGHAMLKVGLYGCCVAAALALGAARAADPSDCQRQALLKHYLDRVAASRPSDGFALDPGGDLAVPVEFTPWWTDPVSARLDPTAETVGVDLQGLVLSSLAHSPRIRYLVEARQIAVTEIDEACAAFDWRSFMDTKYADLDEPVGSTLTTGGPPRLLQHDWTYAGGLRRRLADGSQVEVSQRIGAFNNNAIFIDPERQGNATLALSFARPLLRGAGKDYNTRLIVLAGIDAAATDEEFVRQAQAHILELVESYWQLYLSRAAMLQKRRLYDEARRIHAELESRKEVDVLITQVLQARAAVAKRRTEIIRAEAAVENTQSRIRALVNDPQLAALSELEIVPCELPSPHRFDVDMRDAWQTSLLTRPEIGRIVTQLEATRVKLHVAENELLPTLDLVLEAYSKGLDGQYAIHQALGDQFSEGRPSYSIGLAFEYPLGNRQAKARHRRQQYELAQHMCQLADAAESILSEVEIAVREARTSYREVESTYHAMVAKAAEVRCLEDRWRALAGEGNVASVLLDQLLIAQEGLASAEYAYASAQASYNFALTRIKQADGTLIQLSRHAPCQASCGMPDVLLETRAGAMPTVVSQQGGPGSLTMSHPPVGPIPSAVPPVRTPMVAPRQPSPERTAPLEPEPPEAASPSPSDAPLERIPAPVPEPASEEPRFPQHLPASPGPERTPALVAPLRVPAPAVPERAPALAEPQPTPAPVLPERTPSPFQPERAPAPDSPERLPELVPPAEIPPAALRLPPTRPLRRLPQSAVLRLPIPQ